MARFRYECLWGRRADKTTLNSSDWASYFRYVHDDSSTSSDSFQIYVEDGNEDSSTPVSSTINITISAPALNHYAVSYTADGSSFADASGPNCTAIPVTIVAHDVSDSAVTADTTVTLTTSSGNGIWVSNGTSSIDLAFGGATSVTTYLRHTTAGTTTINVTDGTISEARVKTQPTPSQLPRLISCSTRTLIKTGCQMVQVTTSERSQRAVPTTDYSLASLMGRRLHPGCLHSEPNAHDSTCL